MTAHLVVIELRMCSASLPVVKGEDLLDVAEDILDAVALRQNSAGGERNRVIHDQGQLANVRALRFDQLSHERLSEQKANDIV